MYWQRLQLVLSKTAELVNFDTFLHFFYREFSYLGVLRFDLLPRHQIKPSPYKCIIHTLVIIFAVVVNCFEVYGTFQKTNIQHYSFLLRFHYILLIVMSSLTLVHSLTFSSNFKKLLNIYNLLYDPLNFPAFTVTDMVTVFSKEFISFLLILYIIVKRSWGRTFINLNSWTTTIRTFVQFTISAHEQLVFHLTVLLFIHLIIFSKLCLQQVNRDISQLLKNDKQNKILFHALCDRKLEECHVNVPEVREVFDHVFELVEHVNETFSFHMLFFSFFGFLETIFLIFCVLKAELYPDLVHILKDLQFLTLLLWLVLFIVETIVVVVLCESAVKEAKKTCRLAHRLNFSKALVGLDKEDRFQFCFELVHKKIRFSSYGFLDMNFKLLSSITTAVATYTVVSLQMEAK